MPNCGGIETQTVASTCAGSVAVRCAFRGLRAHLDMLLCCSLRSLRVMSALVKMYVYQPIGLHK